MDTQPQSAPPQRYAPPSSEVADVAGDGQAQLAGRGARLAAAIIDTVILLALWWLVARLTPWNIFSPRMAEAGFMMLTGMALIGIVLFVVVQGWPLATRGQTIGKMLLGLRITRRDGSRASFGRLVGLRYAVGGLIANIPIFGMVYALVDCLFIFRADRRCIHDLIADTIVVKA